MGFHKWLQQQADHTRAEASRQIDQDLAESYRDWPKLSEHPRLAHRLFGNINDE